MSPPLPAAPLPSAPLSRSPSHAHVFRSEVATPTVAEREAAEEAAKPLQRDGPNGSLRPLRQPPRSAGVREESLSPLGAVMKSIGL